MGNQLYTVFPGVGTSAWHERWIGLAVQRLAYKKSYLIKSISLNAKIVPW